ncbi:uncharacterized protein JCM6883_001241 [Sporobolomyces salmoneus]|uniref:uncharacterized protein n=1 Tax=Sporobolomyces salmoneus TaxID=183962 RepID=UPI00317DE580
MNNSYPHTRGLLNYLFTTYTKAKSTSSPPQPLPPSSSISLLESSVRKLALAQSRAASASSSSKAPSEVSSSTDDEDGTGGGGSKSGTSTSSAADELSDDEKTRIVLEKLGDSDIDEDDMPDALKETLSDLLYLPENEHVNLDSHILNLLHRFREDNYPSGNPLPPLPNHGSTTPGSRPSVSRSSSFRRHGTPGALTPGSRTPSNNPNLSSGISNTSSRSPAGSPWSSPKPASLALNPSSSAFKFSVGASEFRPGGGGSVGGGSASGHASPSTPGTPNRIRSPMPMTAQQAQQNWALHHSPLGTPKHSVPPSAPGSAVSSPSYFPRQLDVKAALAANKTKAPRLPWGDVSDSSGADQEGSIDEDFTSSARIDEAPLPLDVNGGYGSGAASPFYPPPAPPGLGGEPQWPQESAYLPQHPQYPPVHINEYGEYVGGSGYESPFYPPQDGTHTPTHGGLRPVPSAPGPAFITLPGPAPGEMPSIDFANQLTGSSGLGEIGAYAMTPFDHLHSIFADSDVSEELLEEALAATGFDVDQSIEYIIDRQIGSRPPPPPPGLVMLDPSASLLDGLPQNRMIASSGSRPLVVSRDSFDGFGRGDGGRGVARFGSRPQTPTGDGRGVGGRVCRFYLAGNCLRSDCKFSHDVGKAVCKFWLRGHCLKGDGRCDFLHTIPPVMRADYEARTRERQLQMQGPPPSAPDEGPELDFPTLGDAPRSYRPIGVPTTNRVVQLDPARTRFSGAVKFGQKVQVPIPTSRPPTSAAVERNGLPQARKSARITLRPPALLPTLPTGQSLANLYIRYRQTFLELGANRNKCLAKAAECFKRGDGAGARKWSREAQDWSRQVAIEGRDSALRIVEERKRVLQEAIERNEGRSGSTDDVPDRKAKGQERGGGICLGVVSSSMLSSTDRHATEDERTEVALDLHALHTDEAISFMGDFLLKLEAQQFRGIAYVVIGQQRHSGSSAPDKGEAAGRLRLEQATTEFLSDQGWAWQNYGGILAIDCLR